MQRTKPFSQLRTLYQLCLLRWRLKKQEAYIGSHLAAFLDSLTDGQSGRFSPAVIKRIKKYWGLSLNVVCDSLYRLAGRQLSKEEQDRILLLSIFSPLYDNLFDDKLLSHDQIEAFTLAPESFAPNGFEEATLQKIYLHILEQVPSREKLIEHLHLVFIWQKASLKQMEQTIGEAELYDITYKKSYYAMLFYYAALDHYPDKAVLDMLYPVAGLLQLTNDAFDVYWDLQSGIYTIPNLYLDFNKLEQKFMADVALINQTLGQLPFVRRAKAVYRITIHALPAMGAIAIDQLRSVAAGIQHPAELARLGRKALICDMDNWQQKLKWVKKVNELVHYS